MGLNIVRWEALVPISDLTYKDNVMFADGQVTDASQTTSIAVSVSSCDEQTI